MITIVGIDDESATMDQVLSAIKWTSRHDGLHDPVLNTILVQLKLAFGVASKVEFVKEFHARCDAGGVVDMRDMGTGKRASEGILDLPTTQEAMVILNAKP